ncbi:MAG: beta-glucosidase [Lachnospiraceae bacterium]|nr:beta-glucosidase [Lachnospiraceae bacterium]
MPRCTPAQPPRKGSSIQCAHKWNHINTAYNSASTGWGTDWERHDTYYCEKCLEQKTLTKTENCREMPEWYRH